IKEAADLAALSLAREIQAYKDEKANELREQINSERGHYASQTDLHAAVAKIEESLKPLQEFVSRSGGRNSGISTAWGVIIILIGLAISVAVPFLTRAPQVIYAPAQQH